MGENWLWLGRKLSWLILLSVCSFSGCGSVEADKNVHEITRMIVTRDTKGVKMQFQSEVGLRYTIFYRDEGIPNDPWKKLPGATELNGTGELILLEDPSPRARYRKYRIRSMLPESSKDPK